MEQWIPLQDYPGYSVSNMGRVRLDRWDRILKLSHLPTGHIYVALWGDGKQRNRSVAKLVIHAFVPNEHDPEVFNTPIHLDGDRTNCTAANLAWRPYWFARKYGAQFRFEYTPTKGVRNTRTGEIFDNLWDLITRDGLLWAEVCIATHTGSYVWPTREYYEWVS